MTNYDNATRIATIEDFKNHATRIIQIAGFTEGSERINVRVKNVSMLKIVGSGNLSNNLVSSVMELFGEGNKKKSKKVKEESAMETITQNPEQMAGMIQLMEKFAESALIEPAFADIKDYITDEQLMDIFTATQEGVTELDTFR